MASGSPNQVWMVQLRRQGGLAGLSLRVAGEEHLHRHRHSPAARDGSEHAGTTSSADLTRGNRPQAAYVPMLAGTGVARQSKRSRAAA
jgi:hypothetical protein